MLEVKAPVRPALIVIKGCMFAGKTEELIRLIRRAEIAGQKVMVFKPKIDDRYGIDCISTHDGMQHPAHCIGVSQDILQLIQADVDVVAIDEVQFLDQLIVQVCRALVMDGKRVVVAGLPLDFRGEPFGSMPLLLCEADEIRELTAICTVCGEDANRTQRLVDGLPADYSEPLIKVDGKGSYEARCLNHHAVPRKG